MIFFMTSPFENPACVSSVRDTSQDHGANGHIADNERSDTMRRISPAARTPGALAELRKSGLAKWRKAVRDSGATVD
jgi:hypothetical protein